MEHQHDRPRVGVRVIWVDGDLIEIAVSVAADAWRGEARGHASGAAMRESGAKLLEWSRGNSGGCRINLCGDDDGDDDEELMTMSFYYADAAGHVACDVTITELNTATGGRLSLTMRTETGLVERFARQMMTLRAVGGSAALDGVAV